MRKSIKIKFLKLEHQWLSAYLIGTIQHTDHKSATLAHYVILDLFLRKAEMWFRESPDKSTVTFKLAEAVALLQLMESEDMPLYDQVYSSVISQKIKQAWQSPTRTGSIISSV